MKGYRKYRRNEEVREFLAQYGISESDLRYLHDALAIVKTLKSRADEAPKGDKPVPTEEQKQAFKEAKEKKGNKPEDIVSMFVDDVEEFYPNGKGRA